MPEELAEYAWLHTGPPGWPEGDRRYGLPALAAFVSREPDPLSYRESSSSLDELTTRLLIDLWQGDVPRLLADESAVDEDEARVLSLMDGRSTVGILLEKSGLPVSALLDTLCELCARGVVTLDRSQRLVR